MPKSKILLPDNIENVLEGYNVMVVSQVPRSMRDRDAKIFLDMTFLAGVRAGLTILEKERDGASSREAGHELAMARIDTLMEEVNRLMEKTTMAYVHSMPVSSLQDQIQDIVRDLSKPKG